MRKIQFIEGDIWSHRKDMIGYYSVPSSMMEKIRNMRIEGKTTGVIGEKVSMEGTLNPEIAAYMVTKEISA